MEKTIAIIYDKDRKPETEVPARRAIDYIRKYCNVTINPKMFNVGITAAIVYGGDGLMLHTANRVASCGIPIIGVNYGRVGYLCKISREKGNNGKHRPLLTTQIWDMIIKEQYLIEARTRISAEITDKNDITEHIDALNEITIGGIDRTVYLKTIINNKINVESVGDGIIISTKTGSTAYNVNAGGSILLTDAFSIVANNSVFKSDAFPVNMKSFVTDVDTKFQVQIINTNERNLPYVIADGQRQRRLSEDDKVIIKKSYNDTLFIKLESVDENKNV